MHPDAITVETPTGYADALLKAGAAKTILVAGADVHAGFMPWQDWDVVRGVADREIATDAYARATRHRGLAVIFGDGAAAMGTRDRPAVDATSDR